MFNTEQTHFDAITATLESCCPKISIDCSIIQRKVFRDLAGGYIAPSTVDSLRRDLLIICFSDILRERYTSMSAHTIHTIVDSFVSPRSLQLMAEAMTLPNLPPHIVLNLYRRGFSRDSPELGPRDVHTAEVARSFSAFVFLVFIHQHQATVRKWLQGRIAGLVEAAYHICCLRDAQTKAQVQKRNQREIIINVTSAPLKENIPPALPPPPAQGIKRTKSKLILDPESTALYDTLAEAVHSYAQSSQYPLSVHLASHVNPTDLRKVLTLNE